jgi:hypothetical protein
MIDFNAVKLGKKYAKYDHRSLKLSSYLPDTLPPIPETVDFSAKVKVPWGQMLNSELGDCTCAAAGHLILQWTANAGVAVIPPDSSILEAYSAITGYNPSDPSSDNGAVELDVLNYWRQNGIGGHKIGAFALVSPHNHDHVKAATYLFGGLYIGVQLPSSAQGAEVWDVPSCGLTGEGEPGSWGGHAVEVVAYDQNGLTVITWGQKMRVTWAFWNAYCDEAYAILSNDFLVGGTQTPEGFALSALNADLQSVSQ